MCKYSAKSENLLQTVPSQTRSLEKPSLKPLFTSIIASFVVCSTELKPRKKSTNCRYQEIHAGRRWVKKIRSTGPEQSVRLIASANHWKMENRAVWHRELFYLWKLRFDNNDNDNSASSNDNVHAGQQMRRLDEDEMKMKSFFDDLAHWLPIHIDLFCELAHLDPWISTNSFLMMLRTRGGVRGRPLWRRSRISPCSL